MAGAAATALAARHRWPRRDQWVSRGPNALAARDPTTTRPPRSRGSTPRIADCNRGRDRPHVTQRRDPSSYSVSHRSRLLPRVWTWNGSLGAGGSGGSGGGGGGGGGGGASSSGIQGPFARSQIHVPIDARVRIIAARTPHQRRSCMFLFVSQGAARVLDKALAHVVGAERRPCRILQKPRLDRLEPVGPPDGPGCDGGGWQEAGCDVPEPRHPLVAAERWSRQERRR